LALVGLLATAPGAAWAQGVGIVHDAPACLLADQFPRFEACVVATSQVARVRINFRAEGTVDWYYVEMVPAGQCFAGVLPKPSAATKRIQYYIDATDEQLSEGRTADFAPQVAEDCGDLTSAGVVSSASVAVGAAAGAPAVPPGFAAVGVVAAAPAPVPGIVAGAEGATSAAGEGASAGTATATEGAAAGAGKAAGAAAAAGAGAAAAGGISAATIGLVAGGVAAAGAAVVVATGGEDEPPPDPRTVDDDGDGFTENQGDCNDSNSSVNPNGTLAFSNARFDPAAVACPVGADGLALDLGVAVDATNNSCETVTISSATINVTITTVENTADTVGETFALSDVPFSPSSIGGAGGRTTVRAATQAGSCTNPAGGDGGFIEMSGTLALETSAGPFQVPVQNAYRVDFPVAGILSPGSAAKGLFR
jgi:hypothetical protein